jgi:hypothetical protein
MPFVNHNASLVIEQVELNIEELEPILAPTPSIPIPPPCRFY